MFDQSITALAAAAVVVATPAAAKAEDFATTLAAHFQAVRSRDLPALERTLTSGEALELYLPNGKRMTTRAEFVAFHAEWFKETTWTMTFEPVSTVTTGDLSLATVRTRYEDVVDGKPYWSESWLTLVFKREAGGWKLVHDQNTRIATSAD